MQSQHLVVMGGECCSVASLKVSIFVLGFLGLLCWGTCIGCLLGYNIDCIGMMPVMLLLLIPINFSYIYVTCRIIFLISTISFPTEAALVDLSKNSSRLVAFIIGGFSVWVTGTVWYATYYDPYDCFLVFFLCSFGFVPAIVVVGMSGGLGDLCSRQLRGGRLVPAAAPMQGPAYRYAPPPPNRPASIAHVPSYGRL